MDIDPITHPRIEIGGVNYEVRFSNAALVKLWKDHQIDIFRLPQNESVSMAMLERTLLILSAGVRPAVAPDVLLELTSLTDISRISEAINAALSKVIPQTPAPIRPEPIAIQ